MKLTGVAGLLCRRITARKRGQPTGPRICVIPSCGDDRRPEALQNLQVPRSGSGHRRTLEPTVAVSRIRPDRVTRRIASALPLLVLFVTLALPARATAAIARVTVTINSVTNISTGDDFGGLPDFVTRIYIGSNVFQSNVVPDNNTPSTAAWTSTASRSTTLGMVPIRIELWDSNDPFPADLVDIDPDLSPGPCAGTSVLLGCSGGGPGPPADPWALDLSLDANPLPNKSAMFTGVRSATGGDATGTADVRTCVAGTEPGVPTATICFTVTITRTPETLRVYKLADTNDGVCIPTHCSLRDAVTTAGPGDTIILPDLGGRYRLTFGDPATPPLPLVGVMPGHLQIRQPGLTILGPPNGAIIEQTLPNARVFDIHPSAGLDLQNVTLTGGSATNNSTAESSHYHGGAIHNHGTLNLVNVTITGNHATLCSSSAICGGGGIYNASSGIATLTNVTIADNDANVDAGGLAGKVMTLHNVLIVDNTGGNGNCDHAEIDAGGNLQYPAGACGVPVATSTPIGQLTSGIYRLPAGSEAIDHGTFRKLLLTVVGEPARSSTPCPFADQIGTARPLDGDGDGIERCDTGAIEYPPTGHSVVHRPIGYPGRLHPATLIFDRIRSPGTSTLRIVRARGDDAPKGFRAGKPARYYDLATTAAYTGRIRVCVRYRRRSLADATAVRLFQRTEKTWTDRTVSLGTRSQRVCGRSPSLGRYAIFARIPKRTTAALSPSK
jgi:hypothetical protein